MVLTLTLPLVDRQKGSMKALEACQYHSTSSFDRTKKKTYRFLQVKGLPRFHKKIQTSWLDWPEVLFYIKTGLFLFAFSSSPWRKRNRSVHKLFAVDCFSTVYNTEEVVLSVYSLFGLYLYRKPSSFFVFILLSVCSQYFLQCFYLPDLFSCVSGRSSGN